MRRQSAYWRCSSTCARCSRTSAALKTHRSSSISARRGFLVIPLALAPAFVAAGGDVIRRLSAFGRTGAAAATLLLLAYPLWPLRANFAANDWSERTQEARFFRALFAQLPMRAAVLPEDYVSDSFLAYLQVESGRRTILQPPPHAGAVRQLFDADEHVYALNSRYGELAPRGFHFVPLRLPPDAQHARAADGQPRRVYRLVGTLQTLPFGDARWHDVTAVAHQGRVGPEGQRDDPLMPEHMIEQEMREHREQAAVLTLLREHLIPDEIYRLTEMDLRFADLVPDFHMEFSAPRRRSSNAAGPGADAFLEP